MKNSLTIIPIQTDHVLENTLQKKHAELKELARKNARHFAKRNLPAPKGDTLPPYTGDVTGGYEGLASEVFHQRQPAAHFPEAKIDAEHLKEKDRQLEADIRALEEQNHHDEYELGNYHPGSIPLRMWLAGIAGLILILGEILFNTTSFQIVGESLLFALIISTSISFAVLFAAHQAAFLYKSAKTVFKRRLVIWCSLFLVTGVFAALSMLRSRYLASHEVNVSPAYFIIFNLFLFIVSALLSLGMLPTLEEIKQQLKHLKLYRALQKRKKEIDKRYQERNRLKEIILANTKYRLRETYHANYVADRIRKMNSEAIDTFKTTNLVFRTDRQTPDCFSASNPEPDIKDITITFLSNGKAE